MRTQQVPTHSPSPIYARLLAVSTVAAMLAGCAGPGDSAKPTGPGPNAPPPGVTPVGVPAPTASAGLRTGNANAAAAAAAVNQDIPKDARYTIVCRGFTGPSHVQEAKISKDNLVQATQRNQFYIIHDEAQSTIYYGYYRERDSGVDPVEAGRASRDLQYLRLLVDPDGQKVFPTSLVVPLPTPDPVAPVEYDLTHLNANKSPDDPSWKFWSIAVQDYTNDFVSDDGRSRKQAVIDVVLAARKQGIEAYYYNGPNTSTVCVGAWPRSAVREQEAGVAAAAAEVAGQEIFVSDRPLTEDERNTIRSRGKDVKIFEPRLEIEDPSLVARMKEFNAYLVNGQPREIDMSDPKTGQKTKVPKGSFLFPIPKKTGTPSLLATDPRRPVEEPGVRNPLAPAGGGTSGAGRLRSVSP